MRVLRRTYAFTLIEMLLVAAILALASGVMAPSMSRAYRNMELRAATREMLSAIEGAAESAVRERAECRIVFQQDGRQFWVEREKTDEGESGFEKISRGAFAGERELPRGVVVRALGGEPARGGLRSVRLMPDGSRERVVIEIENARERRRWIDSGGSLGAAKILRERPSDV